jgi:hypothetical protein
LKAPADVKAVYTDEALENLAGILAAVTDHFASAERRSLQKNEKPANTAGLRQTLLLRKSGAGEGARTLDPDLGKVVLYH